MELLLWRYKYEISNVELLIQCYLCQAMMKLLMQEVLLQVLLIQS